MWAQRLLLHDVVNIKKKITFTKINIKNKLILPKWASLMFMQSLRWSGNHWLESTLLCMSSQHNNKNDHFPLWHFFFTFSSSPNYTALVTVGRHPCWFDVCSYFDCGSWMGWVGLMQGRNRPSTQNGLLGIKLGDNWGHQSVTFISSMRELMRKIISIIGHPIVTWLSLGTQRETKT